MRPFLKLKGRGSRQWGFVAVLLLVGMSLEAEAQSGRRTTKPDSATTTTLPPALTEGPSADSTKQPPSSSLENRVQLLIARQPTSKRFHVEDLILASFVKHLNQHENVEATPIGDLKESRAVERAKAETNAFVILLKFDIDSFQNGTIILNSQDLEIEYFVIAPRTGKKQTKGKVYYQGIGGGRLRKSDWPNGTPIRITPDAAGIEAAEGLYFWLKLATVQNRAR
jgi:hypothetical protein